MNLENMLSDRSQTQSHILHDSGYMEYPKWNSQQAERQLPEAGGGNWAVAA